MNRKQLETEINEIKKDIAELRKSIYLLTFPPRFIIGEKARYKNNWDGRIDNVCIVGINPNPTDSYREYYIKYADSDQLFSAPETRLYKE